MPIVLRLKQQPAVPLEAEVLSPDTLCELSNSEISQLTVYHGKRQLPLSDFFEIEGEKSDEIELHGNLAKVRWIGRAMTRGRITIHGDVGMHLGSYMKAGAIEVHGNAGDWLGGEMKNGFIHIHGDSGGQVGAAYRGSRAGMRNGTIIVDGSAGLEVGMRMRRGTISIGGKARDFCGLQMKGGTIILQDGAEIRAGAWMTRGTIISLKPLQMMPTFADAGDFHSTFLNVYAKKMATRGVVIPFNSSAGTYRRFHGDLSVPGKGEILVWQAHRS